MLVLKLKSPFIGCKKDGVISSVGFEASLINANFGFIILRREGSDLLRFLTGDFLYFSISFSLLFEDSKLKTESDEPLHTEDSPT